MSPTAVLAPIRRPWLATLAFVRRPTAVLALVRRHWLLALLLLAGAGLRVMTIIAYRPAIIYVDSVIVYLNHLPGSNLPYTNDASPDPLGYNLLLLRPVLAAGNLITVVVVQHVLGLAMAVVTYAVLVRRGVWRWLAALATAPVLLDAYQVQIEHSIMSDTLFEALLVAAFATLAWNRHPGWRAIVASGVLIGLATTVRIVGAPLLIILAGYVLIAVPSAGRKIISIIVLFAAFIAPVLTYGQVTTNDKAQFSAYDTRTNTLYARVATFVDCTTLVAPEYEKQLCPHEALGQRHSPDFYVHSPLSPLYHVVVPAGMEIETLVYDFTTRTIRQQPLGLVRAVTHDAVKAFSWNKTNDANPDAPAERWRFQPSFPIYPTAVYLATVQQLGARYGGGPPRSVPLAAALLREYQLHLGFTPGPALLLALLLALGAVLGVGRYRAAALRLSTALYLGGAVFVVGASDFYEFSWRYQLPGLVLIPAAGALGVAALAWRPPPLEFPEPDDLATIESFKAEYDDPRLPPVVVVIAAYNEADGIGSVLDRMPAVTEGLPAAAGERRSTQPLEVAPLEVATLVVVDGGTDGTADVARKHGAYTAVMPRNRGQGAALRLGYHLARTGGARYIVTIDADGQYDIGALPILLEPLRRDEADFVTGSRRLGADESRDQVRRTGVRVFAAIVSVLMRQKITDTSFGFRAMRAEVTAAVTLAQPQYQSSELLIGVLSHGYRVVERPMTMHTRGKGKSKKGNDFVYGMRYARVVFSTWARERSTRALNTKRSSTKNFATNTMAKAPK